MVRFQGFLLVDHRDGHPKNRMNAKLFSLFTITVVVAGSLGYCIRGGLSADFEARNLLEIERAKIIGLNAEWLRRFNTAYSTQRPEIGIWEGTNLLNYLSGKAAVVPVGSFESDVMLTHAKLSGLYVELGATNEAEFHLSEAARIMQERHPGQDFAKAREGIKQFTETNRVARLKQMAK